MKQETKQTAVEFLQECLNIHFSHEQQMQFEGLFQQAKEMEKEQIMEAHYAPKYGCFSEQYYNETYGDNK